MQKNYGLDSVRKTKDTRRVPVKPKPGKAAAKGALKQALKQASKGAPSRSGGIMRDAGPEANPKRADNYKRGKQVAAKNPNRSRSGY